MVKERIIAGVLGAILAILILLSGSIVTGIAISIIAIIGLYEMYNALGISKNNVLLAVLGYIMGFLVLAFANMGILIKNLAPLLFGFVVLLMVYMVIGYKKTSFTQISSCLFSTLYVSMFFSCLILLRNQENGIYYIWVPIIIAWLSDTFAYTFGMIFGSHKLIPDVSPKKTVEGALGGIFGGIVFMVIYALVCAYGFNKEINYLAVVSLGALGTVVSQLGDLAASWIKRENNIKDYGNLMPGHGGVMDRFDSVLLLSPVVYYFVSVFPLFR